MKNKGFTLIELLAVIVILAIIALIATPVILNIINDTRESSNKRSMELYARAVQNAVAHYMMLHPEDNEVTFDDIEEYINYDGAEVSCADRTIKEDGSVALDNCTINGKEGYSYGVKTPVCTLSEETYSYEGGGFSTSVIETGTVEVVTCGSEQFYVMERNTATIKMLTKYNLSTTVSPYKQSSTNAGVIGWGYESSDEVPYWPSDGEYVYDTMENPIKPIVNTYKDYLINTVGVNILSAGLMKESDVLSQGCTVSYGGIWACQNKKYWLDSTDYWLGTIDGDCADYACDLDVSGGWAGLVPEWGDGPNGIRPVITISADQVSM